MRTCLSFCSKNLRIAAWWAASRLFVGLCPTPRKLLKKLDQNFSFLHSLGGGSEKTTPFSNLKIILGIKDRDPEQNNLDFPEVQEEKEAPVFAVPPASGAAKSIFGGSPNK